MWSHKLSDASNLSNRDYFLYQDYTKTPSRELNFIPVDIDSLILFVIAQQPLLFISIHHLRCEVTEHAMVKIMVTWVNLTIYEPLIEIFWKLMLL